MTTPSVPILAALVLFAGCLDFGVDVRDLPLPGADDDDDDDAADDDSAEPTPPPAVDHPVTLSGLAFDPLVVEIAPGDSVTWFNNDSAFHIITAGTPEEPDAEIFESPAIQFGESWTLTFEEAGEVIYFCSNHSRFMRDAKVIVK